MAEKPNVLRPTDDEARALARGLIGEADFASLAVNEPQTGFPAASRVLVATDANGCPVILVSSLAAHSRALSADPRCSLLCGEPKKKGDPLVWPRITVMAVAEQVAQDSQDHAELRSRFLARHPKSALYIDFADFSFWRLVPQAANLNGGFGKAFVLTAADVLADS